MSASIGDTIKQMTSIGSPFNTEQSLNARVLGISTPPRCIGWDRGGIKRLREQRDGELRGVFTNAQAGLRDCVIAGDNRSGAPSVRR